MVKCLTHGLRGFNGAVQRHLATLTVTMLISSCWQLSSEVKLRRIFDVCKRWANSGSHEFVKKNMVRYMRPHRRFAHCSCKNAALSLDFGLSASAAGSYCIFTLAVRQPPVLASCIEIYYFDIFNMVFLQIFVISRKTEIPIKSNFWLTPSNLTRLMNAPENVDEKILKIFFFKL